MNELGMTLAWLAVQVLLRGLPSLALHHIQAGISKLGVDDIEWVTASASDSVAERTTRGTSSTALYWAVRLSAQSPHSTAWRSSASGDSITVVHFHLPGSPFFDSLGAVNVLALKSVSPR